MGNLKNLSDADVQGRLLANVPTSKIYQKTLEEINSRKDSKERERDNTLREIKGMTHKILWLTAIGVVLMVITVIVTVATLVK